MDGGDTFTEPSCIMTGRPERQEDVVVRVHDACFTSGVHIKAGDNLFGTMFCFDLVADSDDHA